MTTIREQLRSNLVAIVSLLIAFAALGYNTWRNERTESNRNVREAGFALLTEAASLQQVVFYAHYREPDDLPADPRGDLRMGWADVLTIVDLAALMPDAVGRDAGALRDAWDEGSSRLGEHTEAHGHTDAAIDAHRRIDEAIDALRRTALAEMRRLD